MMTRIDALLVGTMDRLANQRVAGGLVLLAVLSALFAWFGGSTPGAMVLIWLSIVPFVAVGLVIPGPDRRWVMLVVLGGLSLRLVIAAAVAVLLSSTVYGLFDDTTRYEEIGGAMAAAWHAHHSIDLFAAYQLSVAGYFYVVAALTFLSGGGPFLIGALNASLACLTAPVLYWSAQDLRTNRTERLLAVAIGTFIPSVVLWSALPLKDTAISLVFCLGVLAALRIVAVTSRWRIAWLVALCASLLLLSTIRIYATLFLSVFAVLASTRVWRTRPRWTVASLALVAVVQVWSLQGPEGNLVTTAVTDITTLERIQGNFNGGASGEATPTSVAAGSKRSPAPGSAPPPADPTPTSVAVASEPPPAPSSVPPSGRIERYLSLAIRFPLQFARFFVLPIPFVTPGNSVRLAVPEMLLWYVLLPLAIAGLVILWRRDRGRATAVAILALSMASVYGVIVGNAGSILRYRAQEMLLLSTPMAIGLIAACRRWRDLRRKSR